MPHGPQHSTRQINLNNNIEKKNKQEEPRKPCKKGKKTKSIKYLTYCKNIIKCTV